MRAWADVCAPWGSVEMPGSEQVVGLDSESCECEAGDKRANLDGIVSILPDS